MGQSDAQHATKTAASAARASSGGTPDGGIEPFMAAGRAALAGVSLPPGTSVDDVAVPVVLAVLAEVYRHPAAVPRPASPAGAGTDACVAGQHGQGPVNTVPQVRFSGD